MHKIWKYDSPADELLVADLQKQINVSAFIAESLVKRGVKNFEEAKTFFRPNLDLLHSPFLMLNMQDAVDCVLRNQKNKILIYGDYDVDGTTAVSLLFNFLKRNSFNVEYYIPSRYKEGYGVSLLGVQKAIDENFSLMIALDCGITAVEQAEALKNKGIDFIICDHHLPGEILPNAIILNPKQNNCTYPFKELSGCGVGFKLIQALIQQNIGTIEDVQNHLPLLALSIGADMVPVVGENRLLAALGLQQMNGDYNTGLQLLAKNCKINPPYKMQDIGFTIGPRINAAGRMGDADKVVELFTNPLPKEDLLDIVKDIEEDNNERKHEEETITKEALAMALSREVEGQIFSTVVHHANWKKGVIGIVASQLQKTIYVPTIVLTQNDEDDYFTGSARSVGNINLYECLKECSEFVIKFGGHAAAAGLTIEEKNIPAFSKKFNAVVRQKSVPEDFIPKLHLDAWIDLAQISINSINILNQFEPCGIQNPKPIWASKNVRCKHLDVVGKNHLKLTVFQTHQPEITQNAIFFNGLDYYQKIKEAQFSIAFELDINEWNNQKNIQLLIRDIQF